MFAYLNRFRIWLTENKATVGWIFLVASGWAAENCADIYGINLIALLHITCGQAAAVIAIIGAFLVGAGVLDKDSLTRFKNIQAGKSPERRSASAIPDTATVIVTPVTVPGQPAMEAKPTETTVTISTETAPPKTDGFIK